jgi:hypothetical protein
MHREIALRNLTLRPFYDEVFTILALLSYTSLSHIYRDKKNVVDGISKAVVGMERGTWIISVIHNGHTTKYNHEPWT